MSFQMSKKQKLLRARGYESLLSIRKNSSYMGFVFTDTGVQDFNLM